MFIHNLKIIFRNIYNNKIFSAINIIGLSLGFTGSILILLWVWNEFDYDKFHKNSENIYLLINNNTDDKGNGIDYVESPAPMAEYLVENIPEIENAVRIEYFYRGGLLQVGKDFFKEKGAAVDNSFFEIFSIEFIVGNKLTATSKLESIVISHSVAEKYFGNSNPIGETIRIKGYGEEFKSVEITGVYKDIPDNSSLKFDFLIPFLLEEKSYIDNWEISAFATFVLLKDNSNINQVNKKVSEIYLNTIGDKHFTSYLFPLIKLHLHSDIPFFNNTKKGNLNLIGILILIAILILLMALLNYINLLAAKFHSKSKELGIRKVLGIKKIHILKSFFTETFIYSIVSFQIAIVLIEIFRPLFNAITGQVIVINYFNKEVIISSVIIVFATSLISSLYPLIKISYLNPLPYLKSSFFVKRGTHLFKKALVIFQFTVSIILIIYSGVVLLQIDYIFSKDLGFDKENVIIFNTSDLKENKDILKSSILNHSRVKSVSLGDSPLGGGWPDNWFWDGMNKPEKLEISTINTDSDYLRTLNIKLLNGRFFLPQDADSNYIVINQKFADLIGKEDVLGCRIHFRNNVYEVIGVTNNFYSHHFSTEVKPVAFFKGNSSGILIKLNNDKLNEIVPHLKTEFNKHVTGRAFEFTTLEKQFVQLYSKEVRVGRIFAYFSILAIFISFLGLFATTAFITEQKTKEIGIRKVLGASTIGIFKKLNYNYLKLIAISFLVAFPITIYATNKWLNNFVYKTEQAWSIYFFTSLLVIVTSILALSWQITKVACKNPVNSLRYE